MEIKDISDFKDFKNLLQSGRLNFLIGSGLSVPYLGTLGDTEKQLEESNGAGDSTPTESSIIKTYFDSCISKNHEIRHNLPPDNDFEGVLQNYKSLLHNINKIILLRQNNLLLSKQVNLFTTNFDIFLEKSLEEQKLEFNDGFSGTLDPCFNLSNFKKSLYKTSQHYDNKSEVPMFNLFKLHGSVTWRLDDDEVIKLDSKLEVLNSVKNDINNYDKLPIIKPTKEKFKFTTLNYTYYELLRMFSNELERENSVLFVMGFSFADEHIKEIVLRSIDSNPTLIVYIFPYDSDAAIEIKSNLGYDSKKPKNNNLKFVLPDNTKNDLATINSGHFQGLADSLTEENNGQPATPAPAMVGADANG